VPFGLARASRHLRLLRPSPRSAPAGDMAGAGAGAVAPATARVAAVVRRLTGAEVARRWSAAVVARPSAPSAAPRCAGPSVAPSAAPAGKGTIAEALGKSGVARFAAAVMTAGMEAVFKGAGLYTIFVPSDQAFTSAGNPGTDKKALVKLISVHVLPGTVFAAGIGHAIDANDGKAQLKTMAGDTLSATRDGERIRLASPGGGSATVTASDDVLANGVIHRVDRLLPPGKSSAPIRS